MSLAPQHNREKGAKNDYDHVIVTAMQLARPSRALLSGRGRALLASSAGPSEGTNGERRGRRTYRLELGTAHPVSNVRPLRIVDDVTGEVMDETLRDPGDAQVRLLLRATFHSSPLNN